MSVDSTLAWLSVRKIRVSGRKEAIELYSVDDMRSCIQEWFAEALNPVEVAKTYHEIQQEAEKQLEFMMEQRAGSSEN